MIHDEITTKIDLSGEHKLSESKVVHIDFSSEMKREPKPERQVVPAPVRRQSRSFPGMQSIDLRLPWIVRLVALLAIVGLSVLFF